MSKVVRDCSGFALLRAVIGRENNSHHPIGKSDATLTPIATSSLAFSRAGGRSVHLLWVLSFVLIGRCHNFGIVFKSINRKPLKLTIISFFLSAKVFSKFCSTGFNAGFAPAAHLRRCSILDSWAPNFSSTPLTTESIWISPWTRYRKKKQP